MRRGVCTDERRGSMFVSTSIPVLLPNEGEQNHYKTNEEGCFVLDMVVRVS
jgi:hypothetical protein